MSYDFARFKAPFPSADVSWRLAEVYDRQNKITARALAYLTNRAIMDRLDEVVGPENWRNEFRRGPAGGVLCAISLRIDGEWVTKWDGAENTNIEEVKGGLSDSMKRAAVQWGIGRYLYDLPQGWANVHDNGKKYGKTKTGQGFYWDPPILPPEFLPPTDKAPVPEKPKANGKKQPAERPGSEASAYSKASAAISNAMTPNDLARYIKAIEQRTENGEYTAEEFKKLEAEADARMRQLSGRETASA